MKKEITLPGLNIQYPISQEIRLGNKTVETRFYPIPKKYLNIPMWLIETPGSVGNFSARAIAVVIFDSCFEYTSEAAFYKDSNRHLVDRKSDWKWDKKKNKWGWTISKIYPLKQSIPVSKRRGIVYTNSIKLQTSEQFLFLE
ncbi:hypothetical protein [Bdellovibrio bacteriovorus]|uniref:hypothetical protein n=1 Tax=Bdellovibrio bacteriovorus TaxID=959 RepID=UPI00059FC39A|nr:hypothetical protein [Bdellovibrio bacteriovorus]